MGRWRSVDAQPFDSQQREMCPHGGTVKAISANTRGRASGDYVLRATDTFVITGCPFTLPPPNPCVQVKWVTTARRSRILAIRVTEESQGLCVAADQAVQGTVQVSFAQSRVKGI